MSTVDIDDLRRWIRNEQRASDIVTPGLAERFEATLGHSAYRGAAAAPLAIHWCLAPPAVQPDELGPDGHPARGGFLPPVPLPRRMWAGGALSFHAPLPIGAEVTRNSRIADIVHKTGRSGELVFVTIEHDFDCDGRTVISERQDIVYRGAPSTAPATPGQPGSPAPLPAAGHTETVEATTTLLFRYSALTFNGHRIHYDVDYARDEEGYPGLVVHGPLQATLMLHLGARLAGRSPRSFSYRGLSPLFHGGPFTVNAVRSGDGLDLWCADGHAARTMIASFVF
ncbi:MAG: MaoC family dehydratase N-terminal domain-containing protein [Nitratireductor sp.]